MANFLIDASLPRPTAALVASYGHGATDVRDIGMGAAPDQQIATYAQANQLSILTKDQDFGNLLDYPPNQYHGIAVVQPPARAGRAVILHWLPMKMTTSGRPCAPAKRHCRKQLKAPGSSQADIQV
jgi:hypothetical protein